MLEIAVANDKSAILSRSYDLERQTTTSVVKLLLNRYEKRIRSELEKPSSGIYGLWLGTVNIRGATQLVALNINAQGKSELVLFINNLGLTNETYFDFDQASVVEGQPNTHCNKSSDVCQPNYTAQKVKFVYRRPFIFIQ